MRRRVFITILGGAAVWPLVTRAQQPQRLLRVGYLAGGANADDPEARARRLALLNQLETLGWVAGKNFQIEVRTGGTIKERDFYARELRGMKPDMLIAANTTALTALKEETRIPIVFIQVADPTGDPRIASLARPGGNITGFTNFEFSVGGKWLQILKEMAPALERVHVLLDGQEPQYEEYLRAISVAAPRNGVTVDVQGIVDDATVNAAINSARQPNSGIVVSPGPTTFSTATASSAGWRNSPSPRFIHSLTTSTAAA